MLDICILCIYLLVLKSIILVQRMQAVKTFHLQSTSHLLKATQF